MGQVNSFTVRMYDVMSRHRKTKRSTLTLYSQIKSSQCASHAGLLYGLWEKTTSAQTDHDPTLN